MAAQVKIIEDQYMVVVDLFRKMKFDLKQNIMNCGLVASLEYISLSKIVISLWQCREIRGKLKLFCFKEENFDPWDFISNFEKIVLENSHHLMLPTHFMEMFKELIEIMKLELEDYFDTKIVECKSSRKNKKKQKIYLENLCRIYWENLCWTQEGKINNIKTAEKILEDSNLSVKEKYILACNNCLKEKIQDLFQKLPCSFITEIIINDNFRKSGYRLVLFWTIYFRGKNENYAEFIKEDLIDEELADEELTDEELIDEELIDEEPIDEEPIHETSIYEYLLKWATDKYEDVAFQYIWENLANETEKQQLIEKFIDLLDLSMYKNFNLFLYNKSSAIEPRDLLQVELIDFVFTTLARISRYYKVELLTVYANEFMKTNNVWDSLKLLTFSWFNSNLNIFTLNEHVRIWEKFSLHFTNDIRNNYTKICTNFIDFFSDPKNDSQRLKYPLKMGTFRNKIDILLGSGGVTICVRMLCKSLKCIEEFINFVFDSEEEISQFKTLFLANPGFDRIDSKSSLENYYEHLEELLIKFLSKDEAIRYKNELPYQNNANIIVRICDLYNEVDLLTALYKFIRWCCEDDEDKIVNCTARIFDVETTCYMTHKEHFFCSIESLIGKGEFDLVEKCWKWIFFATEDKITSPKRKLDRIKKILYFGSRKRSELLQMFITSCFEQDEIDELKNELVDSNILLTFVEDIISKKPFNNFLTAEILLDWCYSSDEDAINTFKSKLLRISGVEILLNFVKFPRYEKAVEHLFKWFKMLAESTKLFKDNIIDYIKREESNNLVKVTWNDQKKRLKESLKILTNICREDHAMKEKSDDNVNGNSMKRFSEEASGSTKKRAEVTTQKDLKSLFKKI